MLVARHAMSAGFKAVSPRRSIRAVATLLRQIASSASRPSPGCRRASRRRSSASGPRRAHLVQASRIIASGWSARAELGAGHLSSIQGAGQSELLPARLIGALSSAPGHAWRPPLAWQFAAIGAAKAKGRRYRNRRYKVDRERNRPETKGRYSLALPNRQSTWAAEVLSGFCPGCPKGRMFSCANGSSLRP